MYLVCVCLSECVVLLRCVAATATASSLEMHAMQNKIWFLFSLLFFIYFVSGLRVFNVISINSLQFGVLNFNVEMRISRLYTKKPRNYHLY